jgi:hypothetical protein
LSLSLLAPICNRRVIFSRWRGLKARVISLIIDWHGLQVRTSRSVNKKETSLRGRSEAIQKNSELWIASVFHLAMTAAFDF